VSRESAEGDGVLRFAQDDRGGNERRVGRQAPRGVRSTRGLKPRSQYARDAALKGRSSTEAQGLGASLCSALETKRRALGHGE